MKKFPNIFERYDVEFTSEVYEDLSKITSLFKASINKNVLDLACGTGCLAIPLAKIGANVDAVDANATQICQLNKKITKYKVTKNVKTFQSDILDFKFKKNNYGLILLAGNSIGEIDGIRSVKYIINNIYSSLAPNGKFVFNIFLPYSSSILKNSEGEPTSFRLPSGYKYKRTMEIRYSKRFILFIFRYKKNNSLIYTDIIKMNLFDWKKIFLICKDIFGSKNVKVFEDYNDGSVSKNPKRIIYECSKS